MEENRSFSVIGSLPPIQSAITMGKDSVRIKIEVPLHNQEQRNKIMYLQNLMNCVFKLTFTIESTNQKDYFYPKQKQEIDLAKHRASEPMGDDIKPPEQQNNVEYNTPEKIEQLNKLRSNIHLELMNAGMDTRKSEIIKALANQKRERDCTIEELTKIWQFITQDGYPIQNSTSLRNRLLRLIGGV